MTDLLFTYGTLMRGFGLHRLIAERADYLGDGSASGRLLDLGTYPAAVCDPDAVIAGEVYRLAEAGLWTLLDSTEGPQYHRGEVAVQMADGRRVTAFIYWYVGPLDRGVPIPGGDYRAHGPARSIHRQS
ncbi:MAG TPA: gamma-glutamylcyclotransferase family protein [Candidatus Methylomirabilis sp.]|nr:gamma-glutamylcyclotransferase family protein [Candidatus Methylomirabilis sp.]